MKVEFSRPAPPPADGSEATAESPTHVATATWADGRAVIDCADDDVRQALERAFRSTPVVVTDDASYRRQGTHGEVMVQPGSLEWFRAVAFNRAPTEAGVEARLVPGITEGGFDPAAGYRRFDESIERLSPQ
ncbi:MAG TPA: hypothetical protein VNC60_08960 [Actinomycetota bacterium]|nr:hypothetical protein [Actinomycetota bacterium]